MWGAEQKVFINRERNEKKSGETVDVGGSSAQGGDLGLNESVTLREIDNEAREKAMYERMEWMEKKNGDSDNYLARVEKRAKGNSKGNDESGGGVLGHVNRRNNGTAVRGRTTRRFGC